MKEIFKRKISGWTGILIVLIAISISTASATSSNVVAIGGYDGIASGSGGLPHPNTYFSAFTFATLAPASVNTANLAPYDTVVLNMASSAMGCNPNTLTASAKADLNAFVAAGGKLIIQDAECTGPSKPSGGHYGLDYKWLTYPFETDNPGATGAFGGVLTIFEQNGLSTSTPGPRFIDTAVITAQTDAVGDMNVVNLTTVDKNWCLDMTGTNVNRKSGAVQMYARSGNGLYIYNGLDTNYIGTGAVGPTGQGQLAKIWLQWLQVSNTPTELPCGVSVAGIALSPATATNPVGGSHTVTALVTDLGTPIPGVLVTFNVISGPNAGTTGTATTDAAGQATFTYSDTGGAGTDVITASFTDARGLHTSPNVEKIWSSGPNSVPEFPTMILPAASVLGMIFLLSRKKQ